MTKTLYKKMVAKMTNDEMHTEFVTVISAMIECDKHMLKSPPSERGTFRRANKRNDLLCFALYAEAEKRGFDLRI